MGREPYDLRHCVRHPQIPHLRPKKHQNRTTNKKNMTYSLFHTHCLTPENDLCVRHKSKCLWVLFQNHSYAYDTCLIYKISWGIHFWHRKVSSSNRRRAISLFWSLINANFKNLWIGWAKKVVIPLFCTFSICLGSGHSKNAHLKIMVIFIFGPES